MFDYNKCKLCKTYRETVDEILVEPENVFTTQMIFFSYDYADNLFMVTKDYTFPIDYEKVADKDLPNMINGAIDLFGNIQDCLDFMRTNYNAFVNNTKIIR